MNNEEEKEYLMDYFLCEDGSDDEIVFLLDGRKGILSPNVDLIDREYVVVN